MVNSASVNWMQRLLKLAWHNHIVRGIQAFVRCARRSPPCARNAASLRAAVFTTDVGNGKLPSAFGGAHRRSLATCVFLRR
jgi:hypothetical protein